MRCRRQGQLAELTTLQDARPSGWLITIRVSSTKHFTLQLDPSPIAPASTPPRLVRPGQRATQAPSFGDQTLPSRSVLTPPLSSLFALPPGSGPSDDKPRGRMARAAEADLEKSDASGRDASGTAEMVDANWEPEAGAALHRCVSVPRGDGWTGQLMRGSNSNLKSRHLQSELEVRAEAGCMC